MAWARFEMPPRKIADILLRTSTFCDVDRCKRRGGANLFILRRRFEEIREKGVITAARTSAAAKINVEFNWPTHAHAGNARGGALGDCLAAVLAFAGYSVSREFYVNDAGNQIDKFALSLDIRYRQFFEGGDAPEMPEDSYHGEDIIQRAKEFAEMHGRSYLDKPEQERRGALVDYALPKNLAAMKENLAKYR